MEFNSIQNPLERRKEDAFSKTSCAWILQLLSLSSQRGLRSTKNVPMNSFFLIFSATVSMILINMRVNSQNFTASCHRNRHMRGSMPPRIIVIYLSRLIRAEEKDRIIFYMGLNPKFVLSSCNDTFYLDDQEIDILETCGNAFDVLNVMVERMRKGEKGSSLLPKGQHLSGGFVGYMAYEAIQYQEPKALPPEGRTPKGQKTFAYGYFEDGLVYDNETHKYYYYTRGQHRSDMFQEIMSRSIDKTPPMISNEVDEVSQE